MFIVRFTFLRPSLGWRHTTRMGIMNMDWEHCIVQDTETARGHSRDTRGALERLED